MANSFQSAFHSNLIPIAFLPCSEYTRYGNVHLILYKYLPGVSIAPPPSSNFALLILNLLLNLVDERIPLGKLLSLSLSFIRTLHSFGPGPFIVVLSLSPSSFPPPIDHPEARHHQSFQHLMNSTTSTLTLATTIH